MHTTNSCQSRSEKTIMKILLGLESKKIERESILTCCGNKTSILDILIFRIWEVFNEITITWNEFINQ